MATTTKDTFGDDRLKKDAGTTVRGSRDGADVDRVQQDGSALTAAQRSRLLRDGFTNEILPTPPSIPGYHLCWLSTTNSQDPIYKRVQIGYTPVRCSDVPGFLQTQMQGGEFDGCVACNEMLLFKIPEEIYQEIMMINHFERPNEEEQVLKANAQIQERDSHGQEIGSVEGFDSLARNTGRTPTFA